MKLSANNLMICAMLLGSMLASPSLMAQERISAGGSGPLNVTGHRGSSQATVPQNNNTGRIASAAGSVNERRSTVTVNNNGRMPSSAMQTNQNNSVGRMSTNNNSDRRSTQPSVSYWPGANSATTNNSNNINHRSATVRSDISNANGNAGNDGRRPGNNGNGTVKPYTGNTGNNNNNRPNYNNGNNYNNNHNNSYSGNNYGGNDGRRPGNNNGFNGDFHPYNNNNGNYRPGNSYGYSNNKYDRYRYDGNMRPRNNNDRFYWNYRNNDWRRPVMPPARAYRPERIWYYRPTVPVSYRPYYGAPAIVSILGVDFGTLANSALNFLYYKGYDIDGYYDNVVYLRNVPLLSFTWPDVMMSYDPYSGFNYAQFVYSTPYYDRSRYNRIYRDLCATYGQPINYNNGMCISWYGGDGKGYVTLNLTNEGGRYYTSLSVGL